MSSRECSIMQALLILLVCSNFPPYLSQCSLLLGLGLGGTYGVAEGLKNAPKKKFKIRLNSVLNACGRRGSRVGNAVGVLGVYFVWIKCVFSLTYVTLMFLKQ